MEKTYRDCFGFYPTTKDDRNEWNVYTQVKEKVENYLQTRQITNFNARTRMHELVQFSWGEAHALFEHARGNQGLQRLLPSLEASQGFIFTVLFCAISHKNRSERQMKTQVNHKRTVQPLEEGNKRKREN